MQAAASIGLLLMNVTLQPLVAQQTLYSHRRIRSPRPRTT